MTLNEKIIYSFEAVDKNVLKMFESMKAQFNEMKSTMGIVSQRMKENANATKDVADNFQKAQNKGTGFSNKLSQMGNVLAKLKLNLLSVLFFGMAMKRMFGGLLKPAADAFGIFQLWGTMLEVLFIPTMGLVMPLFLKMFDFFVNLSPAVKEVLGFIALLGLVLGTIIVAVVTGLLGLAGLVIAGVTAAAALITALVVGLILLFALYWDDIKRGAQVVWGWIKDIFTKIWKFIAWVGMQITEGFKWVWEGIVDGAEVVWNFVKTIFTKIGNFIGGIWDGAKKNFTAFKNWAVSWAKKLGSAMWSALPNWIQKLISGTAGLFGKAVRGIGGLFGRGKDDDNQKSPMRVNDFIIRPGQQPVRMNPNDTVVGFKGQAPDLGGSGVNVTQNITISGSMEKEVMKMLKDNNKRLVDDIRRLTGVRGV